MADPNAENNNNEPEDGTIAGNTEPLVDDPSSDNHPNGAALPGAAIPWQKLILVGCLGGFALFLQLTVWTLEMQVKEMKRTNKANTTLTSNSTTSHKQETILNTAPLARSDLFLNRASGYI